MKSQSRLHQTAQRLACTSLGLLLLLFIGQATPNVPGQVTPQVEPQDIQKRAESLIKQLESDDFTQRESAMEGLRKLGAAARPLLVAAVETASLDARLRLEELISSLPAVEKQTTPDGETRLVSVDLQEATLEQALQAVTGDTGISISPNGLKYEGPITLSLKDVPILAAVDALADAVSASWHLDARVSQIRLMGGGTNTPHRIHKGPVRIAAERFMNNRSLSYGGQSTGSCYLQLRIDVDPAAHLIGLWQPIKTSKATDDKGRSLSKPALQTLRFQTVSGRSTHSFTVPLENPAADAKSLSVLEGTVRLAFPKSYEQVTLPMPDPGNEPTVEPGQSIRIRSVSPSDARRRVVVIEAEQKPLQVEGVNNTAVKDYRISFLMVDGRRVKAAQVPFPRRQGELDTFTVPLPTGDVESVHFERLTAIRVEEVIFKLRNLMLP